MESLTEQIASGKFKNIVVLSGAGISTSCGIPDYRSKTGLFQQLRQEFPELQDPSQLFTQQYFHRVRATKIYQEFLTQIGNVEPSAAHKFCVWLDHQGWLRRVYTQNVDGLYQQAGLKPELLVEFHGSLLKNDVVLYGDNIPDACLKQVELDFIKNPVPVDLVIVMGTSLQVAPFCAIPNLVNKDCIRVLVDRDPKNAFTNSFTRTNSQGEYVDYDHNYGGSYVKFGRRKVTLRSHWNDRQAKWKSQHIVPDNCDHWCNEIMAAFASAETTGASTDIEFIGS